MSGLLVVENEEVQKYILLERGTVWGRHFDVSGGEGLRFSNEYSSLLKNIFFFHTEFRISSFSPFN